MVIIGLVILTMSLNIMNCSYAWDGTSNKEFSIDDLGVINKVENNQYSIHMVQPYTNPPYTGNKELHGREFYIKNAYTGQYLDVSGGNAGNKVNVQQYKYNASEAQRWCFLAHESGDFSILTRVGNNGTTYVYALDIDNAGSGDNVNVQIYKYNASDAQKFSLAKVTYGGAYVMYSKCSDYKKVIQVSGKSCTQGANVNQNTLQDVNGAWILEPVLMDKSMGVWYAKNNYNQYVTAYPDLRSFNGEGADCANFASQCMLASGVHFQDDWKVYKKNNNNVAPTNVSQLNNSWELADPSPWISAAEFAKFWKTKRTYNEYKSSDIINNPSQILQLGLGAGDVIQIASKGIFGGIGNAYHTMYITGIDDTSYLLTYHSIEMKDKNFLQICKSYPNDYFIFYKI